MGLTVTVQAGDEVAKQLDKLRKAYEEHSWLGALKAAFHLLRSVLHAPQASGRTVLKAMSLLEWGSGVDEQQFQVLNQEDAVLVVVLHRLSRRYEQEGRPFTLTVIEKVVSMAEVVGIRGSDPEMLATDDRAEETLEEARLVVEESGNSGRLRFLETWVTSLGLSDIEGYSAPEDTTLSG